MKQADNNRTGRLKAEIWARSGENLGKIWDQYGQPTWDPYETGVQKLYGTVGKICGNFLRLHIEGENFLITYVVVVEIKAMVFWNPLMMPDFWADP